MIYSHYLRISKVTAIKSHENLLKDACPVLLDRDKQLLTWIAFFKWYQYFLFLFYLKMPYILIFCIISILVLNLSNTIQDGLLFTLPW